jgi:ectoine hydroxylase-related dioxygenase (phytanoyl-CoA dioxygenase family)
MPYPNLSDAQVQSLTRLWQTTLRTSSEASPTWESDLRQIYDLGLGMQELLAYLYETKPDLSGLLYWANSHSNVHAANSSEIADVLSASDIAHWNTHGYVVVKAAVTVQQHTAATRAIWEFLGADPAVPESWYQPHPAKNGLMVVFTQHESLQAIRNSPRIRKAYEQLYGTTAIYKVIDKVSFNPPQHAGYKFAGSPLHWDTSLELPIPDRFQGLLYLTDVTAEGGAFQCVPGFHHEIQRWIENLPAGTDPRQYALETLQPVPIPGNAGDFIIWHQALPHCASPNFGHQPRLVQYLTYIPEGFEDHRGWK